MTNTLSPSSPQLVTPDSLCRSWCEQLNARVLRDGALEVELLGSWLGSERLRCIVEERSRRFVVTDLGSIYGELWVRGVHRIGHIEAYARALGFEVGHHHELSRSIADASEAAAAIAELSQVASLALSELLRVQFSAPAIIVSDVWTNLVTRALGEEPHTEVVDVRDGTHLDRENVIRNAVMVMHRGEPLVVSPIMGNDSSADFTKLFYFLEMAGDSVRGVMPLIRAKHRGLTATMVEDLTEKAAKFNRRFDFVAVQPADERYRQDDRVFPALRQLESASERLRRMYLELALAA